MSPRQVSVNVGAMCYDVGMNTRVEDAILEANRDHVAARQGVGGRPAGMSQQARTRAHTERTSRYGKEPHYGEH
jgi:hypothetical protein